jgi:hypothetical protein
MSGDKGYNQRGVGGRSGGDAYNRRTDQKPFQRADLRNSGPLAITKKWTGGVTGPPVVRNFDITPLMTFKSFMQVQSDDLPPEVFQKRYEEYNLNYLVDFSDAFFKASVGEEWFQDRWVHQSQRNALLTN